MRRLNLTLLIAGLFAIASCGPQDDRLVAHESNHSQDDDSVGSEDPNGTHGGPAQEDDSISSADPDDERADVEAGADRASEPSRPVEILLQWETDEIDLDLIMRAPDEVDYQNDTPTAQGWLHAGDTCPEQFGVGCTDTLVDGAFSESIWLTVDGAFDGQVPAATLRRGDHGDEVKALQAALNHAGFNAGQADGAFGPLTEEGVERLQSSAGLNVTGIYDRAAQRALTDRLIPGNSYTIDVRTFGMTESTASFDLVVLHNGEEVQSFTGQTAAALGESETFEFTLGGGEDSTPDDRPADKGTELGTFFNTYYYLTDESGYSGADNTTLYDDQCNPIADVPSDFADAACIEGSARLDDGTVINYHSQCSCGPCSFCWSEMDPNRHPWGKGSRNNALEPLRSWAVDTSVIPHGTVVYVEAWDGVDIPQVGELGGFTHDGCFRADDVGGGINGNHFDFFAGTPQMWQALEAIHPTRTNFTVYGDSPRCAHL